jgi:hypothetical protein
VTAKQYFDQHATNGRAVIRWRRRRDETTGAREPQLWLCLPNDRQRRLLACDDLGINDENNRDEGFLEPFGFDTPVAQIASRHHIHNMAVMSDRRAFRRGRAA